MTSENKDKRNLLSSLPSVDELLKSPAGAGLLDRFRRRFVLHAIRDVIDSKRRAILEGTITSVEPERLFEEIGKAVEKLSSHSLVPVINATGIVIHTNLGRAALSEKILLKVVEAGRGYSNLEYNLEAGKRGSRHTHTKRLLREITGAEDALIVNNNAAAVLLCLNTMAAGREVIVSRGELVEIGGSFRVPDVMAASGAVLKEVGTTNKTHLHDYAGAVNENTALLLKVHQSNYKIAGFTADVKAEELVSFGKKHHLPVMFDLGSGCLIDLRPYGIANEPSVQEVVKSGADIVTFSGDKLLGGPQGGIIAGRKRFIERIQKNPLARALRIDKLTIAAFEATLMTYADPEVAKREIPVLNMLFQPVEEIRGRASRIASGLRKALRDTAVSVVRDSSKAGGGALPEVEFPTFAVSLRPAGVSVNELESRLRKCSPPVIARIKEDSLLLDARTIQGHEIASVVKAVALSLSEEYRR